MTERKALKLALEAFDDRSSLMKWQEARDAVKEVLAQPEQEQVAYTGNGTAGREADARPTGFFFQMPPREKNT